jgi:hypothetical protein
MGGKAPGCEFDGGEAIGFSVAARWRVVKLDEPRSAGGTVFFLSAGGSRSEEVHPVEVLRDSPFHGAVVLQTQPTDWRLLLAREQHVPERRGDGLCGRRAVGKLGQSYQDIDEQCRRRSIIGVGVGSNMEIRGLHGSLCAVTPESLETP